MKKRLNKNEKALLQNIQTLQMRSIINLKSKSSHLIKVTEDLIKKIESQGINGYYSINNDCLRLAEDVWKTSMALAEMKKLEDEIRETLGATKKSSST
jgi:hypothetical protein